MEQTVSLESIFRTEASVFGRQQTVERNFQEVVEGRRSEELARLLADRRAKLSWLIEQAQENLSRMLHTGGKEFDDYMQALFKVHARPRKDNIGVCGFKKPILKWKTPGKKTPQLLSQGGPGQVLVGTMDDYKISVRVLELYEEKAIQKVRREIPFSMEEPVGGYGEPHSCQILALTCMVSNGWSDPTPEQIRKTKLVHLNQLAHSDTLEVEYSEAKPVSLDQGFIDTLLELVIPETTLRLLFKKFGTAKAEKPEY